MTTVYPKLLQRILCGANACGVNQGDRHTLQHNLALQDIPGRTRKIRHDRPLPAAEAIQQGTLTNIRATNQSHL